MSVAKGLSVCATLDCKSYFKRLNLLIKCNCCNGIVRKLVCGLIQYHKIAMNDVLRLSYDNHPVTELCTVMFSVY